MSVFNTAAKPGSGNEESYDSDKEDGNRNHSVLTCKVNSKRFKKALYGTPRSINCGESVDSCIKVESICNIKVVRVDASTSSQSNESTLEIDNHTYTTVLDPNWLPVHYFEILVDVSG